MNTKTSILALALAVLATGACKKNTAQNEPKIPIRISSTVSKVSEDSFVSGDAIGLYVVNATEAEGGSWTSGILSSEGNHLNNVKFTYNGSWEADQQYYWKDARTKADFYCYYPYVSGIGDVTAVQMHLEADQSSREAFEACEILWGKTLLVTPTDNKVSIISGHRNSQIVIELKPGKGFTRESLLAATSSIKVNNIMLDASLNLQNGELRASGNGTDVIPYYDGSAYRAMIPPQKIDNAALVTLVIDGLERTLVQTVDFTSNSRKKCTITIDKLNEGVNVSIGGWEDDNNDYGGTLN